MKKNLLSLAVAAGLTVAGTANAVFVNPEGHGQVLLYPYYTVEGGQDTYINLVNTTDQTKAVKVRFIEAMNSKEVLDFNLYLSPRDHWSAVVFANGEGAAIRTADTSCTVSSLSATLPGVAGPVVPFRDYEYNVEGETFNTLARTREGYVEIIEMGVISAEGVAEGDATTAVNGIVAGIKHGSNGIPANCGAVTAAWETGIWSGGDEDASAGIGVSAPTGGLYGYGVLMNVSEGTNATYDAVALDQFGDIALHYYPGSVLPSLEQSVPYGQVLQAGEDGVAVVDFDVESTSGIDAVSAVLMHSSIVNDYVLEPSIDAGTDWVITFPTKTNYVNSTTARRPFTSLWDAKTGNACEAIALQYWDREELGVRPADIDFSPRPPSGPAFSLCREANVMTFNGSDVLSPSERVRRNLDVVHNNGWLQMSFVTPQNRAARVLPATDVNTDAAIEFVGLPVIGFAVQKYVNGTLSNGVLSNYTGSVEHKYTRTIEAATPAP